LNRAGRTVNAGNVECFVDRITNIEIIEGTVSGECPVTTSIDTEVTDSAGYCSCSECIVSIVDVGTSERATRTDCYISFSQRLTFTTNSGSVVRAVNRDLYGARCTVNTGNVEGFVDRIADIQVIKCTIGGEDPIARCIDCKYADTTIDCGRVKFIIRIIDISADQRT